MPDSTSKEDRQILLNTNLLLDSGADSCFLSATLYQSILQHYPNKINGVQLISRVDSKDFVKVIVGNNTTSKGEGCNLALDLLFTNGRIITIQIKCYVLDKMSAILTNKIVLSKGILKALGYSLQHNLEILGTNFVTDATNNLVIDLTDMDNITSRSLNQISIHPNALKSLSEMHIRIAQEFPYITDADTLNKISTHINFGLKPYELTLSTKFDSTKFVKPYSAPLQDLKEYIAESIKLGLLGEVNDPDEPIAMVPIFKLKGAVKDRWVYDFRSLNSFVKFSHNFTTPDGEVLLNDTSQFQLYHTIDLSKAYNQISLSPKGHQIGITTNQGTYRILKLPFGLVSAGNIFMSRLHHLLEAARIIIRQSLKTQNLKQEFYIANYVDDVICCANDQEILQVIKDDLLKIFAIVKFHINVTKSKFFQQKIKFLGKLITYKSINIDPEKIRALSLLTPPTTIKLIQSFLGLVNFNSRFIRDYQRKAKSLYYQLTKNAIWDQQAIDKTFYAIIEDLSQAVSLTPFDFTAPLKIYTDGSGSGTGAVLFQTLPDLSICGYYSRSLHQTDKKLSATQLELLAMYNVLKHEKLVRYFSQIIIYTDHKPLLGLLDKGKDETNPRIIRMINYIQALPLELHYIAGEGNISDYLSRATSNQPQGENTEVIHATTKINRIKSLLPLQTDSSESPARITPRFDDEETAADEDIGTNSNIASPPTSIFQLSTTQISYIQQHYHQLQLVSKEWSEFINQNVIIDDHDQTLFRVQNLLFLYLDDSTFQAKMKQFHSQYHGSPRLLLQYAKDNQLFNPHAKLITATTVGTCTRCTVFATWEQLTPELQARRIASFGSIIHLDFVEIRYGDNFYRYILHAIEYVSGMSFTFPTNTQLDTHLRYSSNYHPASNGLVEAKNKLLKRLLKATTNDFINWSQSLPKATMLLNHLKTTVGYSPSFLFNGTTLSQLQFNSYFKLNQEITDSAIQIDYYKDYPKSLYQIDTVYYRLNDLQRIKNDRTNNSNEKTRLRTLKQILINRYAHQGTFSVGEWVFKYKPKLKKSDPNADGPYLIARVFDKDAYKLQHANGKLVKGTYNFRHLKPAYSYFGSPIRTLSDIKTGIEKEEKRYIRDKIKEIDSTLQQT
ncbi:hypothetical protein WICMUC_000496 [Wickerhamomyces mucosus]|uniref:Uncharacterized protein n=1 Tax=Wickerhamomyces mucosus TaxID=1378264 RepID=A0A9P8PXM8_9ASCO|nr:hypothetical protein WICMUC_000496 [Wickerhamomyces mucosus]